MTPAVRLWKELAAAGVTLAVVGEELRYAGPKQALSDARKRLLRQHKAEIVNLVKAMDPSKGEQDESSMLAARQDGWLVLHEGSAYSMQLSKTRMVFLLREPDDTWNVWRGDWKAGESKPYSQSTLGHGYTFAEALERGNDYVQWWRNR